jgi:hypothetical protein
VTRRGDQRKKNIVDGDRFAQTRRTVTADDARFVLLVQSPRSVPAAACEDVQTLDCVRDRVEAGKQHSTIRMMPKIIRVSLNYRIVVFVLVNQCPQISAHISLTLWTMSFKRSAPSCWRTSESHLSIGATSTVTYGSGGVISAGWISRVTESYS